MKAVIPWLGFSLMGVAATGAASTLGATDPTLVGPVLSGAGALAFGTAGNFITDWFKKIGRHEAAIYFDGYSAIEHNHVVLRELRLAQLNALRRVISRLEQTRRIEDPQSQQFIDSFTYTIVSFVDREVSLAQDAAEFARVLSAASSADEPIEGPLTLLSDAFNSSLLPRGADRSDPMHDMKLWVETAVLGEIALASDGVPEAFLDIFGANDGWFANFVTEAAVKLKTLPDFERLWNAEQLAVMTNVARRISAKIEGLDTAIAASTGTLHVLVQRFESLENAFHQSASNLSAEIGAGFDKLGAQLSAREERLPFPRRAGQRLLYTQAASADLATRLKLVGQPPSWRHILSGAYAHRRDAMPLLKDQFEIWYSGVRDASSSNLIPVFWMHGRSGDGKSVLALQLAEDILKSDPAFQIFKASNATALPLLMEFICATTSVEDNVIVFVDDLHLLGEREAAALLSELESILDTAGGVIPLVTCGPSKEMQVFLRKHAQIDGYRCAMPPLSGGDLSALKDWLGLTDRQINREPGAGASLVDLLFEAKVGGSLQKFATSLGNRLRERGLFDPIVTAVALNAIDIPAPMSLLKTTSERLALEELFEADDLHFERCRFLDEDAFKTVHSRIAWHLCAEWIGREFRTPDLLALFAERLVSALAIVATNSAYARLALQSARDKLPTFPQFCDEAADSLQRRFLANCLRAASAYPHVLAVIIAEGLGWLEANGGGDEFDLIGRGRKFLDADQSPSRDRGDIAASLACLEKAGWKGAGGARALAFKILEEPGQAALSGFAVGKLIANRVCGLSDYGERWLEMYPDHGVHVIRASVARRDLRARAVELAIAWVRARGRNHGVLATLAQWAGRSEDVGAVILDLVDIKAFESRIVLSTLLTVAPFREAVVAKALSWMALHGSERGAFAVLIRLLLSSTETVEDDVAQHAVNWVEVNEDSNRAVLVIRSMLKNMGRRLDVYDCAVDWLGRCASERAYAAVMLSLLSLRTRKRESVALTLDWIERHPDAPNIPELFAAALAASKGNVEVVTATLHWCRTRASPDIKRVRLLGPLAAHGANQEELRALMAEWLDAEVDLSDAPHLLSIALVVDPRSPALRARALALFENLQDRLGVAHLLDAMLCADKESADLHARALAWCTRFRDHTETHFVLSRLVLIARNDVSVKDFAVAWVRQHADAREAVSVLSQLVKRAPLDAEVTAVAFDWLNENAESRQAPKLLLSLLENGGVDRAVDAALSWLEKNPHDGSRILVLSGLALVAADDKRVHAVILAALQGEVKPAELTLLLARWLEGAENVAPVVDEVLRLGRIRVGGSDRAHETFQAIANACASVQIKVSAQAKLRPEIADELNFLLQWAEPSSTFSPKKGRHKRKKF